MNKVEPIKNIGEISLLKKELKKQSYRDYLLFVIGINTGINIRDLLLLTIDDLVDQKGLVSVIHIKGRDYPLNDTVRECLSNYIVTLNQQKSSYIFSSRKGLAPIDRSHAYRIINNAAKRVGIKVKIGTQTMRKTFGFHFYIQHRDVKYLQKLFNHSSDRQTLDYIGIDRDFIKEYQKFSL